MFYSIFLLLLIQFHFIQSYVEYQPEQIHLSLSNNGRDMVVTWSTPDSTGDSIVEYGIDKINLEAIGKETIFVDGGPEKRKQEIHRVLLPNLKPDTVYKYRCGGEKGWSPVFWFKTFPAGDDWIPSIAIYGDLGNKEALSLPYLQKEAQNGVYDAVLHIGDFAYDMETDNGGYGDEFMRQIEPVAAYLPYMTSPGNHENAYNFSHYKERFSMPGDNQGLYYSLNIGPVHFLFFSSELYYYTEYLGPEKQYEWIINDLEEATKPENRAKHPWIIVLAHRPMYCTSFNSDDCTFKNTKTRVGLGIPRKYGLESVFYKYGVDMEIWAHEHTYERFYPLYDYKVYNGSMDEPYVNPKAPIHIISGSAGCQEGHDQFTPKQPSYSAFRTRDYGYTRFKAYNHTHLYLEQVSINARKVVDQFWVVKDSHKPYTIL